MALHLQIPSLSLTIHPPAQTASSISLLPIPDNSAATRSTLPFQHSIHHSRSPLLQTCLPVTLPDDIPDDIFICRQSNSLDRTVRLDEAIQAVAESMQTDGAAVPVTILLQLLQRCTMERNLSTGIHLHFLIIAVGLEANVFVGSSLVHMFALSGGLQEASQGFHKLARRNVYSWTAIMEAHVHIGDGEKAVQVYHAMRKSSVEMDGHAFVAILKACAMVAILDLGMQIHACIIENGLDVNIFVGSALINMYIKCGSLHEAYLTFDRLSKRNVITWSALILGYVDHGDSKDALRLFQTMEMEGVEPNEVTYLCLLKACANIAAMEHGKHLHSRIIRSGLQSDIFIGNTLIDMYSKCGSLSDALIVFNRMPIKDVISWSALIAGYAKQNNYKDALLLFQGMQKTMIKPNDVTYLSLISACGHVGLVNEGCQHFMDMVVCNGILPTLQHYNSLIDLLGRSGLLKEAEDLLESLPFSADYVGWISLLDSCRMAGSVQQGKRCFDRAVVIDNQSTLGYVLMSNIYMNAGLWNDVRDLDELRRCANLWKKPAKAFIEINNCVHDFIVDDQNHPQADEIYAKLRLLSSQIREEGYVPQVDIDMKSLTNIGKENSLCGHSEKLAIAFGLINTPEGTTIRVAKNLRMCKDCHNIVKMISKVEQRQIIVIDAYCVHQFENGVCCCRDEYA